MASTEEIRDATEGNATPKDTLKDLGGAFDNVGKIAAGIATVGGVAYIVALLVVGLRLHDAGLPSDEVLSTVPRDQLVVAGTFELLATLVGAAILVVLAVLSRRLLVVQVLMILVLAVILPVSLLGLVWLVATGALVALFRFWVHPPVAAVIVVVALAAVALTLTRQAVFPTPFAGATVALKTEGGSDGGQAVREPPIAGKYIGATSTDVLVGVNGKQRKAVEKMLQGSKVADSLVMIPRARIDQVVLSSSRRPVEPPESLAARAGLEITCLIPTCRLGDRSLVTPQ